MNTLITTTVFMVKDDHYNYLLKGTEIILCPLGHRKPKHIKLSHIELCVILDYIKPLLALCNECEYIEGFVNETLDIEDDLLAYIDSLM